MGKEKRKPNKDGYYRASFVIDSRNGQQRRVTVRAKSEKELEQAIMRKKIEFEQGLITINGNTTVERWANEWHETYNTDIINKQKQRYQGIIKNYILPEIGKLKLCDVKPIHLQRILNGSADKSKSHISFLKNTLNRMFDQAEANDLISKNPARRISAPEGKSGSRRSITDTERKAFLSVCEKHPKGVMFCITLACGLRPGEVRALRWERNIDLKNKVITVTNAVESGTITEKGPKTKSGERTVPIPNWFVPKLMSIKKDIGLVFPTESKKIMSERTYYRGWKSFKRLMDIELGAKIYRNQVVQSVIDNNLTPYYLRHTYATDLAASGVDLKTAQYLMGHSDIQTTANIYTHVTTQMIEQAAKKINGDVKGTKHTKKTANH